MQRVGTAPDKVSADDTQLYGVGAFLLAASEVAKLPAPTYAVCPAKIAGMQAGPSDTQKLYQQIARSDCRSDC